MIASIAWLQSACKERWFVKVVPIYSDSSTLAKKLLSVFILWLPSAFWSRDMTMYLVLSAFASTPFCISVFVFVISYINPYSDAFRCPLMTSSGSSILLYFLISSTERWFHTRDEGMSKITWYPSYDRWILKRVGLKISVSSNMHNMLHKIWFW